MPPPRPRAPPPLPDELVEEVLLRVRPDDPTSLVRAALASRHWRGLVADPSFRRRRLDLHGAAPPMLGIMCEGTWDDGDQRPFSRYIPTSSFVPLRSDHHNWLLSDARHGRVLLHRRIEWEHWVFAVWNPITDELVNLPRPPDTLGNRSMKAAVLCAAATGACDHRDCHRGPFTVVLVGTNNDFQDTYADNDYIEEALDELDARDILWGGYRRVPKDMFTCVYSSESGAWSKPVYGSYPGDDLGWERSVLVGNALYFVLRRYDNILQYDLGTRKISVIRLPYYMHTDTISTDFLRIELTTIGDGQLGFARVEGSHELCLWSRDGDNRIAGWRWTQCKVINLNKLFPLVDSVHLMNCLVGFAEGICVAFVEVDHELFTVDMKSGMKKKVAEGCSISYAVPHFNFCTSALKASSRDDGPIVGTSSASTADVFFF